MNATQLTTTFLNRLLTLGAAILLLAALPLQAHPPELRWARTVGGPGFDYATSITSDRSGNIIVAGAFTETITYLVGTNTNTVVSAGGFDIVLAKFNRNGGLLWIRRAGGYADDVPQALATDAAGNIYMAGSFQGAAQFGTNTLNCAGESDIFVAKYSPKGEAIWARRAGGIGIDAATGIAVAPNNTIGVTGYFTDSAGFDSNNVSGSGREIFTSCYDARGNVRWVHSGGGAGTDQGAAIAADARGDFYVTGFISGPASFEGASLPSTSPTSAFFARYNNRGGLAWVQAPQGDTAGTGVAVDSSRHPYFTGHFTGTATFGTNTNTVVSAGLGDIFLTRFDPRGTPDWVRSAGGSEDDRAYAVAVNRAGQPFVTGCFAGTALFGDIELTSNGGSDLFIWKSGRDGRSIWAGNVGGLEHDSGVAVHITANGQIAVAGQLTDTGYFGAATVTSAGSSDLILFLQNALHKAMHNHPQ